MVRKLVLASAPGKSDGWYPEVRAGMKSMNAEVGKTRTGELTDLCGAGMLNSSGHAGRYPTMFEYRFE